MQLLCPASLGGLIVGEVGAGLSCFLCSHAGSQLPAAWGAACQPDYMSARYISTSGVEHNWNPKASDRGPGTDPRTSLHPPTSAFIPFPPISLC